MIQGKAHQVSLSDTSVRTVKNTMGYTILIADDNKISLTAIKLMLQSAPEQYTILLAVDGSEAVDLAFIHRPDLILLNWQMPKLTGIDVLKILKSHPDTKNIPVIMETGFTSAENLEMALEAGAADYIRSPIERSELLSRVKTSLQLYNTYREIINQNAKIKSQIDELKFYSIAANQAANAMLVLTPDGEISWSNDGFEKLYSATLQEFTYKFGSNYFHMKKSDQLDELLRKFEDSEVTQTFVSQAKDLHGKAFWVHTSMTVVKNASNLIERYIIVETDVTQIKTIDEELKKKNETMQTLNKHLEKANEILKQQKHEIEEQKEAIEREKVNTDNLLLNILPHHVASQLKTSGYAKPRNYNMVSVMFTDFEGFTKSCEKLSPNQIVEALHNFFAEFDDVITNHYIEKIKTIGDAYMCAGGIPLRNRSNPFDVILAALEIQKFMSKYPTMEQFKKLPFWRLRIGIHTGAVTAGVVGKIKFAYDIWGDTVNIAKRMESASNVNMVNISGATYEFVKDYFDCIYRGKIEIKNRGRMDMYFVQGLKPEFALDNERIKPNDKFLEIHNSL